IWQLYLSLSICTGIGAAIVTVANFRLLVQWFTKFRSTAFGINVSLCSLVAFILPYIMVPVNNNLGPAWTFRIIGLSILALQLVAFPLVKERKRASESPMKEIRDTLDLSLLKNLNFLVWTCIGPIQLYAFYITFTYVPSYATYIGLTDFQGGAIVSVLALTGVVGRILVGMAGDRIGNLNTFTVCMAISAFSVLVIWTFAYTFATMILFAVVQGFVGGTYFSLSTPITAVVVGIEKFPGAMGIRCIALSLIVFGPFLANYLKSMRIFIGASYAVCALLTLFLKFRLDKRPWAKI
ncbi:major facilitator superfamily domain-containing protein, partial [Fennellomyces sp. T-0311]